MTGKAITLYHEADPGGNDNHDKGTAVTEKDLQVAREFKRKVKGVVDLLDFKVFGSRARGDGDEYSDLDLFLEVAALDRQQKEKIADVAWEVGLQHLMVLAPIIFTKEELENTPLRASSLVTVVAEEGIPV